MSSSDSISISLPFQQSLLTQPFLQLASLKGKPSFRGLVCSCQSQQRGSIKPRFPCPETDMRLFPSGGWCARSEVPRVGRPCCSRGCCARVGSAACLGRFPSAGVPGAQLSTPRIEILLSARCPCLLCSWQVQAWGKTIIDARGWPLGVRVSLLEGLRCTANWQKLCGILSNQPKSFGPIFFSANASLVVLNTSGGGLCPWASDCAGLPERVSLADDCPLFFLLKSMVVFSPSWERTSCS